MDEPDRHTLYSNQRGDVHVAPFFWTVPVLTLIALFSCSTITAIAIGQAAGMPDHMAALGMSRCEMPCYFGLAPGATHWEDASQSLSSRSRISNQNQIVVELQPHGEADIYPSIDGHSVGRIYVFLPPVVQIGWLLEVYGDPCGITLYPHSTLFTLRYPSMLANVSIEDRRFSDASILSSLQFTDPAWFTDIRPNLCNDDVTVYGAFNTRWRGVPGVRQLLRRFAMID